MTNGVTQEIHLFFEQAAATEAVPVRKGVSCVMPGGAGSLGPVGDALELPANACRVEPVCNQQGQPRLLLINPPQARTRVNGHPVPLVAVLREKDFLQFADGSAAHVSVLHRPHIGPPGPELLGRECPVCRLKFEPEAKCYQCGCGIAFHCEDSGGGLECAQTRAECACGRPIILREGFTYQPDTDHE